MDSNVSFDQLNMADNILMWGAGYHTEEVLRFYKSFFEKKNLWITDKNKAGESIAGYSILESGEIDYKNIDLAVIMSANYHDEINNTLKYQYGYQGLVVGLYSFRRILLNLDSHEQCRCHLEDFIHHMENGVKSYSYDYIFEEKFKQYRKIKLFAWWASSIGEGIRYLLAYYHDVFKNKPEDEYYLLIPYNNGRDFANGRFIEIVSRVMPVVTYGNCHFWEYVFKKYPKRFDWECYNDYNGILVDAYDQFDPRLCKGCLGDMKFPIISYISEEMNEITDKLMAMGISEEFICIFARDSAYLQHQTGNPIYSFNDIRDMDIKTFESAEEYLDEKGIKSIRMGKVVNRPVDLPNCIDYATEYHNDLMDLYLLGKCKFFAGSMSGITALAQMQGVPIVLLGIVNIGMYNSLPYRSDDIFVPKKVYNKKEKRTLCFTEMWDAEMLAKDKGAIYYRDHELEFIECSQEEIREAIIEMNEKIDGVYKEDEQEKELQEGYHALLNSWIEKRGYHYSYFFHCNISGSFIKKNAFLLEECNMI